MNKILIDRDILDDYSDKYINIENSCITFKQSGDYTITYNNCQKISTAFNILDNVCVNLFEVSIDNDVKVNNIYNLNNNSSLIISKFYSNKNTFENIEINLNKRNANIEYYFSNICIDKERYKIVINHNYKDTLSYVQNNLITVNNSNLNIEIESNVPQNNVNCTLNQNTRAISDNKNNVTIKPNMYIDCNDVIAKHSSTIGTFNESDLFYLMSRGISYNDAYKLLIKGFIFSNLKVDKMKREKIMTIINCYWR